MGKKNNTHLRRFNTTPLCYKHSLLLLPHRGLGRPDPRTTSHFSLKWLYLSICETQVPSVTCYILQARQTMPWGQINLHDLRFISCSLCLSRKGQRGVSHPHVTETSLTGCCRPVAALSGTHPPPQCQGWSRAKNLEGHSPDFKSFCTEGTHFFSHCPRGLAKLSAAGDGGGHGSLASRDCLVHSGEYTASPLPWEPLDSAIGIWVFGGAAVPTKPGRNLRN